MMFEVVIVLNVNLILVCIMVIIKILLLKYFCLVIFMLVVG